MDSQNYLEELFGDKVNFTKDGALSSLAKNQAINQIRAGDTEFLVLFFGANFSPPSRLLNADLKNQYTTMNAGEKFKVVYVSSDKEEDYYNNVVKSMEGWFAVPFGDTKVTEKMQSKYQVSELPTLVVVDLSGMTVVSPQARNDAYLRSASALESWRVQLKQ